MKIRNTRTGGSRSRIPRHDGQRFRQYLKNGPLPTADLRPQTEKQVLTVRISQEKTTYGFPHIKVRLLSKGPAHTTWHKERRIMNAAIASNRMCRTATIMKPLLVQRIGYKEQDWLSRNHGNQERENPTNRCS